MGRAAAPSWWASSRSTGGGKGRWARTCTPLASASMRYGGGASAGRGIHGGGAPPSLPSRLLTSANPRSRPGEGAPNQKLGQRKPKPGYRPVLGEVMQGGPCSWSVSLEAPLSLEPASGGPMVSSGLCGPSHIPRPGTLVGRQPPVNRTDVN